MVDIKDLAAKIKQQFKGDKTKEALISLGSDLQTPTKPEDFVVLSDWWKNATGLLGLPYGYLFMIAGNTDSGKCLGKDTPVLMYDGSVKKVQDIKVGDLLMGPDSKHRTVMALGSGQEEMFRITPNYGYLNWECNKSHILSLQDSRTKNIKNISVDEYLKMSKTDKWNYKLYRTSVEFQTQEVPYDPYFIGLWLGDGTTTKPEITKDEPELDEYLEKFCLENNFIYKKTNYPSMVANNKCRSYTITTVRGQNNPFLKYIKSSLTQNGIKTIPKEYLINSYSNRLKLLAGLLDSDGHLNSTGQSAYEIVQKHKMLADQIAFLASSLGFRVSLKEKIVNDVIYYRIHITGHTSEIPCILERKKAKQFKGNRNPLRTGFKIESLGIGTYYGFTLKEDPLFCLADTTVTHNTSFAIEAMAAAQAQKVNVIYVDTERKTTKSRLTQWGVDPEQIAIVHPQYLEEAYDGIDFWINAIKDADEKAKILVIFDSLGNTPSIKETEQTVDDTLQLGLAAKVNKRGLRRLMPRLARDKVHILIINQTYNNLGSPGRSNAGGNAADYFSSLTFQTSRAGWLEGTVQGKKVRKGAKVKWDLYKNHLIEAGEFKEKSLMLKITDEGINLG